jgi:hypothetical protein
VGAQACDVNGAVVRTVALTGQAAPGTSDGTVFVDFEGLSVNGPAINNHGQTAFRAVVHSTIGDGASGDKPGVWSEESGALNLLLLGENPLYPILNDIGNTAFYAGNRVWMTRVGSLVAAASTGSQAADVPAGTTYFSVSSPRINNNGDLVFRAFLQPNTDGGIWAGTPNSLKLIARQGDQAAGIEAGGRYQYFLFNPALNNAGQVAFLASLTGTDDVPNDDGGIWTGQSGVLRLVAREGSDASGTPVGSVFDRLNPPTLGDEGQVAYLGFLREGSGDVVADNSQGIWMDRHGVPSVIVRAGDSAPGTPSSAVFRSFNDPVLGGSDHIAFRGFLREGVGGVTTESRMGIWSGAGDSMKLIARTQGPAPGTQGVFNFMDLDSLSINDRGQVAFLGGLQNGDGGVTQNDSRGIWAEDVTGVLRVVIRTGSELEVAPNDFRLLTGLNLLGTSSKVGSGFNNLGQVAFIANFADGSSGIFVSNQIAIPEPATQVLALVAAFAACAGQSHSRLGIRNSGISKSGQRWSVHFVDVRSICYVD